MNRLNRISETDSAHSQWKENMNSRILPLFLACTFLFFIAQIYDVHAKVPSYRVFETKNVSFGNVRRLNIRVSLPHHYSRKQVEQIVKVIVADTTHEQEVNAISIWFFGPNTSPSGAWDIASVDWAPNGRWADADTVKAGDYRTFRYTVNYKPPIEASATNLEPSGKAGLLGTPLPVGATLVERTAGDPQFGTDPREQYRVKASASEIAAYFYGEMPKAGWLKDGSSSEGYLFFRKDGKMIVVIINCNGGTFTLMGS